MKKVLAVFLSLLLMLPLSVLPTMVVTADIEGRVLRDINLKGNVNKTLTGNGYVCGPATTFPTTDLSGYAYADLAVEFDMYIEGDVAAFKSGMDAYLEVTSSGAADKNEINWNLSGINWQADKWFRTTLKFSNSSKGSSDTIDLSKVNYIRMYLYAPGGNNKTYVVKYCNFRIVDLSKGAVGTDTVGDGTFKVNPPDWKLVDTEYETTEAIIAGYNLGDYLAPNTDTDATPVVQTLIDALGAGSSNDSIKTSGGGTLFIPAGTYNFYGNLQIPYGIKLVGDWRAPTDENPEAVGTIFKIYAGKGSDSGKPFITMLPNSCVEGITFWYPEQDPENIVPYPLTIQMYKPGNWGADYTHVRNCTFINSYRAIQQGPEGSGCPNVYNVYGTPLYKGVSQDNIYDIGRFDYMYFSPKYWESCGLPGAPTTEAAKAAVREYLLKNAVAFEIGRVDWSYWCFSEVDGYNIGLCLIESPGDPSISYSNGHVYGMTFKNCDTAIRVNGASTSAAQLFCNIKIEKCKVGILTTDEQQELGNINMSCITIDADTAIKHDGNVRFFINTFEILRGGVEASGGMLVMTGSTFHTAAPQVTMKKGASQAILQGNTVVSGEFAVNNLALCPVEISDKKVAMKEIDWLTPEQAKDEVKKAAREVLYVADFDNTGKSDITAKLQALLTKAGNEGGGYVFLPGGYYRLNGSVTVPSGVELCGAVDVGRNPVQLGTILQVYGMQSEATIILSAKSGLRGIVVNYPEQNNSDATLKAYPYAVQGRGEDIYIVNFSIRNGYDGIDLMTYRCDNHYVKYFAGYCFHRVFKVGGGAVGGKIINYQTNGSSWWNGSESKFGSWPNSPTSAQQAEGTGSAWKLGNIYMQNECIILTVGDVTDQILYNNFSYSGALGSYYIEENGKAANGWNVGNGYDYSSTGIKVDALGDMDFINVQIVSYNYTGEVPNTHHIYATEKFDDELNIVNLACWAQPESYIRADNGTVNVYCGTYTDGAKTNAFATIGDKAKVTLQNGAVTNGGVSSWSKSNLKNLTVNGYVNEHTIAGQAECNWGTNMLRVTRWDVPQNATIDTSRKMLFTEAFTNYSTDTINEVANAFTRNGTFNALSAINQNGNVTRVKDGNNDMMRLFHNNAAQTAYARSSALRMASGRSNNTYMLETRLNVKSLRDDEFAQVFIAVYNLTASAASSVTSLVSFAPEGVFVGEEKLADYTNDTWYRVQIDFDLTDINNKTYKVRLLDDEYKELAVSAAIAFDSDYQGNTNDVGALNIAAMADTAESANRNTEVLADYVFVTQDPSVPQGNVLGDVDGNGKVNTTDARKILQFSAGIIQANELDVAAADVDQSGKVNTTDARKVLQYAAGIITTF